MKRPMMIIGLALLAGMAQATVLTFDTGGGVPQDYGEKQFFRVRSGN